MELKYKDWESISINVFNQLKGNISTDTDELKVLDNKIKLLSILCDVDEDKISALGIGEFTELLRQTSFLNEMPKAKIQDRYIINGKEYKVFLSMKNMSVAQYIDFQTYYKEQDKYLKELLSVFLIPTGKKYGEDYNIDNVINDIGEHLSIVDARSILFFFVLLFRTLTTVMLGCSTKDLKKMSKKMKNKENIEKIKLTIQQIEKINRLAKDGVGFI